MSLKIVAMSAMKQMMGKMRDALAGKGERENTRGYLQKP